MAVANLIMSPFILVFGLFGGVIVEWLGYRPVFYAGLGLAVFSFLWFLFAVKDPRSLPRDKAGDDMALPAGQGAWDGAANSTLPTNPK